MFYFLAEDGKMKNRERGEGGNITIFHKYRLRWQLVLSLFSTRNSEWSNTTEESLTGGDYDGNDGRFPQVAIEAQ